VLYSRTRSTYQVHAAGAVLELARTITLDGADRETSSKLKIFKTHASFDELKTAI
jgi:hypothetical protein